MNHIDTDGMDLFIVETAMDVMDAVMNASLRPYAHLKHSKAHYDTSEDPSQDRPDDIALFPRFLDQKSFMDRLKPDENGRGKRSSEPLALSWHAGIGDHLAGVVVRVLAQHALGDWNVDEKAIQLMVQRTAHRWAEQFSVLDLRAFAPLDLKALPMLLEHDAQVIRWKRAPGGSAEEINANRQFCAAFDKLTEQYIQADGEFSRMFPSARVVAEAIGRSLDRKLASTMTALKEIDHVRAQMAQDNSRPGAGLAADVLPVRVEAAETPEARAARASGMNQVVAAAAARRTAEARRRGP